MPAETIVVGVELQWYLLRAHDLVMVGLASSPEDASEEPKDALVLLLLAPLQDILVAFH